MFAPTRIKRLVIIALLVSMSAGIARAAPPRQDDFGLPEPQFCTQDSPVMTSIAELGPEYIDDQTVLVSYSNELGQTFSVTLSSGDPEMLQAYVDSVLICYEAVDVDLEALRGLASEITFGDVFVTTLSRFTSVEELMSARLENPELTLSGYLEEQGIVTLEEFLTTALEAAYFEIDTAVNEEQLLPEVADTLRGEVERMYVEAVETPGIPIVPLDEDPSQEVSIEVDLVDGAGINEESYFIFSAVDPFLSQYRCANHYMPSKAASVYLSVSQGRVSGWVYFGAGYVWYLYAGRGQTVKSPYIWANRVRACGWDGSNTYYTWN